MKNKFLIILVAFVFLLTACSISGKTNDTDLDVDRPEIIDENDVENENEEPIDSDTSKDDVSDTEEDIEDADSDDSSKDTSDTEDAEDKNEDQDADLDDFNDMKDDGTKLTLYYLRDNGFETVLVREVHLVEKTDEVAKAALNELISGQIKTKDAFRPLPEKTKINSIKINDGLAVIDFSKEVLNMAIGSGGESAAIQAIVNTLTEFPTITEVEFWVDGSKENANEWWGHVGLDGIELKRDLSNVENN